MLGRNQIKLVDVQPFGSIVSNQGDLDVPKGKAVDSLNLRSNRKVGYYIPIPGRSNYQTGFANHYIWLCVGKLYSRVVNSSSTPYTYALAVYYVALAINTSRQRLVLVYFNQSLVQEIDIGSGISTTGNNPNPNYTPGPADEGVAATLGAETYFCYGKIYGPYWNTDAGYTDQRFAIPAVKIIPETTAMVAQLPPPNALGNLAPVGSGTWENASATGSGNLNGYYSYYFTVSQVVDGVTQESSPAPLTFGITRVLPSGQVAPASDIFIIPATNQVINISFPTGLDTVLTSAPYNYPSTATINVYRNSSASLSGQPQFVGSFALTSLSGGHTFQDDYADSTISGQALITHQDPPPNFFTMRAHKSRMFGFGWGLFSAPNPASTNFNSHLSHASELWYSAVNQGWSWDGTNQVIDCGRNDQGDNAVALAVAGSVLLCLKNKSTWILYGSTPADFIAIPTFEVGAVSQRLTIEAYGVVFWAAPNGQIWMYNGNLICISADIQEELYELVKNQPNVYFSGNGWAHGRSVFFGFDYGTAVYEYQIDRNEWWKNGVIVDVGYYDTQTQECLGFVNSTSTVFAELYQNEGDFGNSMYSFWTSPVMDCGDALVTKEFTHVLVQGLSYADSVTIQVTVDPGPNQIQNSVVVSLNSNQVRQIVSLPKGMIGNEVQVKISTTVTDYMELQRVSLYGVIKRRGVIPG